MRFRPARSHDVWRSHDGHMRSDGHTTCPLCVFRGVGSSKTSWSFWSVRRVTVWRSAGRRTNSDTVSSTNQDWPAGLHDNGHVRVLILLTDSDLNPDQRWSDSPIRLSDKHPSTVMSYMTSSVTSPGCLLINVKVVCFLLFILYWGGGDVVIHWSSTTDTWYRYMKLTFYIQIPKLRLFVCLLCGVYGVKIKRVFAKILSKLLFTKNMFLILLFSHFQHLKVVSF